jgi:hypothetical protein
MIKAKRTSRPRVAARMSVSLVSALLLVAAIVTPSLGASGHPRGMAKPGAKQFEAIHNTCKRSPSDIPACGVLWGLFTPSQQYRPIEKKIGRRFDIVKNYTDWRPGTTFPTAKERRLAAGGRRILDISWNAIDYPTRAKISYQSIAAGDWDKSVILPETRKLKSFHHKIFMDFSHEFDSHAQSGRGTPAQYVAAYRHIHHLFRLAGVKNVIWVWVSTGDIYHAKTLKAGYPGAAYVNWIGYDPYNFAECMKWPWRSPYTTFHPFYHWLKKQPKMRHKPIMLGEYASAQGSAIGAWYAAVAPTLKRMPKIKAVMQWSAMTSPVCDFRLTQSAQALAGFAASSNSPYILGVKR